MSRQYPIWVENTAKNKSFGTRDYEKLNIKVGTSSMNSHHFANIKLTYSYSESFRTRIYSLYIDGHLIKKAVMEEGGESPIIDTDIIDTVFNNTNRLRDFQHVKEEISRNEG